MGALTEIEIFDRMADCLKQAVGNAHDLAVKPLKGKSYMTLRENLKLIEGCCRQAAVWRQDARWYPIGLMMEECHKRAGEWLRGVKDPITGRRRLIPEGTRHPLFLKLAENLEGLLRQVIMLRLQATGRMGTILPTPLEGPHRQTRDNYALGLPEGMRQRESGLIVPSGVAA